MTTTAANRAEIARIADTRTVIDQAAAEGRVLRGELPTWRENALERAGDYARAGEWRESRRMAKQFETGA